MERGTGTFWGIAEKESDGKPKREKRQTYLADLNLYSEMAYYVAKKIHLRPIEILQQWGVCELIVAFGVYKNEEQLKNFHEVQEYNKTAKKKVKIDRYAVKFMKREDFK